MVNLVATVFLAMLALTMATATAQSSDPVKVFILAGQSNMEGKAPVEVLTRQIANPDYATRFAHLHDGGAFIERYDVFIKFLNRRGPLTVGFGSPNRIGPELQFGFVMGDHFNEPVLLIKTAWGGKSIARDFRPPSAGSPPEDELNELLRRTNEQNEKNNRPLVTMDDIRESYGHFYRAMMDDVRSTVADAGTLFPALAGRELELAGFVWFQGWNDQYNGFEREYETNLAHLIRDVRRDLNSPKLPFVIGVMGQNGSTPAKGAMLTIQQAQLSMETMPDFAGGVMAVRTDELIDTAAEQLYPEWEQRRDEWDQVGGDHPYHYYGSPTWFMRIGSAFADAMIELMPDE